MATHFLWQHPLTPLIAKSRSGEPLSPEDAATLLASSSADHWPQLFDAAAAITAARFQKTIRFFAPLYFSNYCVNNCAYCGFRNSNRIAERRALSLEEFRQESFHLWRHGHRCLVLIAGEHPDFASVENILVYLKILRQEPLPFHLMLEAAPFETDDYRRLYENGVGQCLLFQETYHRETYERLHRGPKKNFAWRYEALHRALRAGIRKVGLGILLGLYDWKEDFISLIRHAWELKKEFGVFPATLSFPRLRPAPGIDFQGHPVSDEDFIRLIALARLTLPETGIVLSTRERPDLRDRLLEMGIGVTHVSAGSSTTPGGYSLYEDTESGQFNLSDTRPLCDVQRFAQTLGYQGN